MPEYTPIKLVWKYHDQDPGTAEPRECRVLYADNESIAKFFKSDAEFMSRHKIELPLFVVRHGYENLLPWHVIGRQLGDGDLLFHLSAQGKTSVNFDDVCSMEDVAVICRQPDGSFRTDNA